MNLEEGTALNINSLRYCLRQSLFSIYRNIWLVLITAGIIAVSLAIFGGFLLLAVNTNQIIKNIGSNVEIVVFLKEGAKILEIEEKLSNLPGIKSLTFVSKEEGLINFSKTMKDKIPLEGLRGENNPLPNLFKVRVEKTELVSKIAQTISDFEGVEAVDYGERIVDLINKLRNWLNTGFLMISSFLAFGAVFLIITTIKLSVLSRQDEIGIMKYLGASNSFIRFPFILEGMVIGWIGTILAGSVLSVIYSRFAIYLSKESFIFFIQPVTDMKLILPIFLGLLLAGTFLGGVGSLVSVHRHLKV